MYSSFEPVERFAIKTSLVVGWLFIALGALGGILLPPITVAAEIGGLSSAGSWVALVFSLAAAIGVSSNRYWIEWVAAWFVAMGLSAYAVTVWTLVLSNTPTRLQQAGYITALVCFTIVRIAFNAAHASKQRAIKEQMELIKSKMESEGE